MAKRAQKNTTRKNAQCKAGGRSRKNLLAETALGLSAWQSARDLGLEKKLLGKDGGKRHHNPEPDELTPDTLPQSSQLSLGHIEFTDYGSIERYVRDGYVYRAFTSTPVFEDGYRMGVPEESVETFVAENPAKYERCVRAVQKRGKGNAYAICTAQGLRNPRRGRNPQPASDAVYEDFHGTPATETLEIVEDVRVHSWLGGLADLVHLVVKLTAGTRSGKEVQLNAPDPMKADENDVVRLTANEDMSQLYFSGGDQTLDLESLGFRRSFDIVHDGEHFEATDMKDLMVIGLITRVMYRTEKSFDNFEEVDYHHMHGEDTKKYPTLLYDTMNSRMLCAGGEYAITPAGIVN